MPSEGFILYSYFRSSAAFRVRIALNLKGIVPEMRFVHLLKDGGAQHSADYRALNPQGLVPALIHDGRVITQSLAIIDYLDEIAPEPPLLPADASGRARVREIAYAIACDIHPLNNLRMGRYLKREFGRSDDDVAAWQRHWIEIGFDALEAMLVRAPETGLFCHGDAPTLADICLIPQMFNARRLKIDVARWPTLARIGENALTLPAFVDALPQNQPDAE